MRAFLKTIFDLANPDEKVTIWSVSGDEKRVLTLTVADLHDGATDAKLTNVDSSGAVYFGTTTRHADWQSVKGSRGGAVDVATVTCLWVDLDVVGPNHAPRPSGSADFATDHDAHSFLSVYEAAGIPASIIISTGGGFHAYWLLDEPLTPDEASPLMQKMQDSFPHASVAAAPSYSEATDQHRLPTPDPLTIDLARVMRLPGSRNHKSGGDVLVKRAGGARTSTHQARYGYSDIEEALEGIIAANPLPVGELHAYQSPSHTAPNPRIAPGVSVEDFLSRPSTANYDEAALEYLALDLHGRRERIVAALVDRGWTNVKWTRDLSSCQLKHPESQTDNASSATVGGKLRARGELDERDVTDAITVYSNRAEPFATHFAEAWRHAESHGRASITVNGLDVLRACGIVNDAAMPVRHVEVDGSESQYGDQSPIVNGDSRHGGATSITSLIPRIIEREESKVEFFDPFAEGLPDKEYDRDGDIESSLTLEMFPPPMLAEMAARRKAGSLLSDAAIAASVLIDTMSLLSCFQFADQPKAAIASGRQAYVRNINQLFVMSALSGSAKDSVIGSARDGGLLALLSRYVQMFPMHRPIITPTTAEFLDDDNKDVMERQIVLVRRARHEAKIVEIQQTIESKGGDPERAADALVAIQALIAECDAELAEIDNGTKKSNKEPRGRRLAKDVNRIVADVSTEPFGQSQSPEGLVGALGQSPMLVFLTSESTGIKRMFDFDDAGRKLPSSAVLTCYEGESLGKVHSSDSHRTRSSTNGVFGGAWILQPAAVASILASPGAAELGVVQRVSMLPYRGRIEGLDTITPCEPGEYLNAIAKLGAEAYVAARGGLRFSVDSNDKVAVSTWSFPIIYSTPDVAAASRRMTLQLIVTEDDAPFAASLASKRTSKTMRFAGMYAAVMAAWNNRANNPYLNEGSAATPYITTGSPAMPMAGSEPYVAPEAQFVIRKEQYVMANLIATVVEAETLRTYEASLEMEQSKLVRNETNKEAARREAQVRAGAEGRGDLSRIHTLIDKIIEEHGEGCAFPGGNTGAPSSLRKLRSECKLRNIDPPAERVSIVKGENNKSVWTFLA